MPGHRHPLYDMRHSNCHPQRGGARFYIRNTLTSWSPLTESNPRPSPYHLKSLRFSGRQVVPAGRRQAVIRLLPRPAVSAAAPAIAPTARQRPLRVHAQLVTAPARACPAAWAWPVGLHAGLLRPLRRSKDGQMIFPVPPAQGPEPALGRYFSIARKNLNQCPYLRATESHRRQTQGTRRRTCRGTCRRQSQRSWPPGRHSHPRAGSYRRIPCRVKVRARPPGRLRWWVRVRASSRGCGRGSAAGPRPGRAVRELGLASSSAAFRSCSSAR